MQMIFCFKHNFEEDNSFTVNNFPFDPGTKITIYKCKCGRKKVFAKNPLGHVYMLDPFWAEKTLEGENNNG